MSLNEHYMDPGYSTKRRYDSDVVENYLREACSNNLGEKSLDFSYQGKSYSLRSSERSVCLIAVGVNLIAIKQRDGTFLVNGQVLSYVQLENKVLAIIFPPRPKPRVPTPLDKVIAECYHQSY